MQLIGGHSDDIDIALDNVMGTAFAQKVNEYLIFKNLETYDNKLQLLIGWHHTATIISLLRINFTTSQHHHHGVVGMTSSQHSHLSDLSS